MSFVIPAIFRAINQVTAPVREMVASVQTLGAVSESVSVKNAFINKSISGIGNAADIAFGKVVNLKNALIGGFVVGGAKKLFDITADVASMGDELATTAGRIGMTTQAFQEFGYAAKLQNIEQETLVKSFEKLNKNMGDLHHGTGTLETQLKKSNPHLLVQLKHVKDTEQAFTILSAAIYKLPNQMERASLAQAAFGKSGQEMLNLIQAGPEALSEWRQEAERLGFVLSKDMVEAASKFDDAHDRMNFMMMGLKVTLGGALMPLIMQYMDRVKDWVTSHRELIQTKVNLFVDAIAQSVSFLAQHYEQIKSGIIFFIKGMLLLKAVSVAATVWTYANAVATGVYNTYLFITDAAMRKATIAQWLMNAAMLANPVTWITLAIIALVAILIWAAVKFKGWGEQWAAVIGWMKEIGHAFSLHVKLQWLLLQEAFWILVDALVLAWNWAQNKLGIISDQQFEKNKKQIADEHAQRVNAIRETTKELMASAAKVAQLPAWKLQWDNESATSKISKNIPGMGAINGLLQNDTANTKPVVPIVPSFANSYGNKAMQDQAQQPKQGGVLEIRLIDETGKASIVKNTTGIPIKLTPSIGQ